jgi:KDO2-lipid IV(A) lauroyltransferase
MTVVVEPLHPPELFEWFAGLRSNLGMNVVPLGPNVAAEISAALKRNEVVCLLCDRDIQRTGVAVTMFGEETTLPGGPALLSIRSGAALIPAAVYFDGKVDGHWAIVRPPLQIERGESLRDDTMRLTQLLAGELEFLIRRAPEQWHLLQPNWPSDPGYQVPSTR